MNPYAWIFGLCAELWSNDQDAIADAIVALSDASSEGDMDALDANYPVVTAFARDTGKPWVELYARHCRQQAFLNFGTRADLMLPEVVETIAMTMRDDVRECPQSICAIQDLSLCYAAVDAPGYAAARLKAIDDILPKLDMQLGCASCLFNERLNALCSLKRFDEALDYGLDWIERAERAGLDWTEEVASNETKQRDLINAAVGAGRFDLAQAWLDAMQLNFEQSGFWKSLGLARLALARGAPDEARDLMPKLDEARPTWALLRRLWLDVTFQLIEADGRPIDDTLMREAEKVAETCEVNGLIRDAFNSRVECAWLAMRRDDRVTAHGHYSLARTLRDKLQGSHGADERLQALQASI